ncbi:hypothetical protein TNCT_148361 [Trichonephila clavata]|uniref:Uncharacterized protein n=1 Tax=Trichonephila clavata TaxID=2740835 RepID=A0A8X6HYW6_TRICU|nr:hypothetical protein TNCT_148361 [Trichonephila clavata]
MLIPPDVKRMTNCKKRAWMASKIQQLEVLITGYAKLEFLPKCPANTHLLQMTRIEKKGAISKRDFLVSELAVIPPCLDPVTIQSSNLKNLK